MNHNKRDFTSGTPDSLKLLSEDLQREVDAFAEFSGCPSIDLEILACGPATILVSPRVSESSREGLSVALQFTAEKLLSWRGFSQRVLFRAVGLTRLDQVIGCGCDVVPSHAPFYATEYAQKALEYGDVVMAFDPAKLDTTFKKVLKSECPETLRRLRSEYPIEEVIDETWLRFSRPSPSNGRIRAASYSHYDFFIPGNPHEALLMIFLIGNDRNSLRAEFLRCGGRTNQL